jgi:membrane protease YdiL (CAAX protease family)
VKILKKHFNKKAMLFGCLYPIGFISICAATAVILMHEAVMVENNLVIWFITELLTILIGLFFTLGEEYGWRGYLLPRLTKIYGKRKAVIITGIVWSLYHIPIVYLLAKSTGLGNPLFLCAIQSGVVFVSNFAFSYCYYLSESIIPVMFYHSIWNVFNTAVLGDIYNGKQGAISGNILVINGEGILGLILATIAGVYFWKKLSGKQELG